VKANEGKRQESELAINIRKATSIEEVSPKRTSATSETFDRSSQRPQASMSVHVLYTRGITRALPRSGRA
jgi:hypothetical protein